MIYSFKTNSGDSSLPYFSILEDMGDFIYCDKSFFLNTDMPIDIIHEKLNNVKLNVVTSQNLSIINSDMARKWCEDIFIKEELARFEQTEACQQRLREINKLLDILEKGGAKDGQAKKKSRTHTKSGPSSSENIGNRGKVEEVHSDQGSK